MELIDLTGKVVVEAEVLGGDDSWLEVLFTDGSRLVVRPGEASGVNIQLSEAAS